MDFRRQSSLRNEATLLRAWGICWAVCLAAASTVSAQMFAPMTPGAASGSIYGDPNMSSVYSPAGPQTAFGSGQPGYGPGWMDQDLQMIHANGMSEPGQLQNVNFAQPLGDYGDMQMYGAPAGQPGFGAQYRARPATWAHVRDLQIGVYTNEEQTVINGGSTFEFYVDDRYGLGGRVLLGGANNDRYTDEFHFSGDLYAGTTRFGEHWIKGGVIYDIQDNFHKVGPALGMLLFSDRKHPISVDFAYGIGYGDPIINRVNSTIITVADDDVQLRAGTYVTPNLQLGFSGNWLNWADGRFEDYNAYGGFFNLNLGTLNLNVDVNHGDDRTRGFVNIAYTFGGRRERLKNDAGYCVHVEHPRDWLGKPVMRDVSLQTQRVRVDTLPPLPGPPGPAPPVLTTLVGNLTQVNFRIGAGSGGLDGIIDANETFEIDVQLVNGSGATSNQILSGNVASTSNLGFVFGGQNVVSVGSLLPGQQVNINLPDFGTILVPGGAQVGDQFFIDFDVSADGQTRRFRVPITIGVSSTAAGFAPTIPI
jgi:hypothetical protein